MNELNLELFLDGYIECALWSTVDDRECENDGMPGFLDSVDAELSDSAREKMRKDCERFIIENQTDLCELSDDHHTSESQMGHDFWLSRNGHGAGFFDRGNGDVDDRLQDVCRRWPEAYLYVGDDNLIYHD